MHNHTECHCVNRGSLLRDRDEDSMALRGKRSGHHSHQHQHHHHISTPLSGRKLASASPVHDGGDIDCRCPRHFQSFKLEKAMQDVHLPRLHNGFGWYCRCACAPSSSTCQRFASGEEAFPLDDRKYINNMFNVLFRRPHSQFPVIPCNIISDAF